MVAHGRAAEPETIHAVCVALGERGVLIRGAAGAGKSTLARRLVAHVRARDGFARIVADDRVRLQVGGGRLLARPVPSIAGLIEIRGVGLRRVEHEPAAVVRLVVDLLDAPADRLPEPIARRAKLLGLELPRLAGPAHADMAEIVLAWCDDPDGGLVTE